MPEIDYGSHAASAPPPAGAIDYGSHGEQESGQGLASQASDLVSHAWNQFSGAVTGTIAALHHPIEAISTEKQRSADLLGKAADAWKKGDKGAALDFAAEAVPVLGTLNKQSQQEFLKGKYGAGFGDLLGFFGAAKLGEKAPALIKGTAEAIPKAAGKLSGELKTPGTAQIIAGTGEVIGGVAAVTHEPIGGLATAAYGIRQVQKGLAARRAALTAKLQNAQAATRAAQETAAKATRPPDVQPMTPQIDTSTELSPEADAAITARRAARELQPPPSPPGWTRAPGAEVAAQPTPSSGAPIQSMAQIPSMPVGIRPAEAAAPEATAAPAATSAVPGDLLDQISVSLAGKRFDRLTPQAQATVQNVADQMKARAAGPPAVAQAIEPTAPPEAVTPTAQVIPFKQPEIPKEVYEQTARAEKVKNWADLFEQHGIDAEDVKLMAEHTPGSEIGEQWSKLAEASGLKIPSLTTTEQIVKELRSRKTKLSPQMEQKLKLSGAMSTAENLRDIMALDSATKQ